MAKRIKIIKEVDDIIGRITKATQDLLTLSKKTKSKELSKLLATFVIYYSELTYKVSIILMSKAMDYYKKDKIDVEFEKLMKKNFKMKNGDK